ncbi:MAG: hypothetical protein IPN67_19145 [Bacteroidales bacterium]|nr:hypothetical protein [Bacteroidales bacterium]
MLIINDIINFSYLRLQEILKALNSRIIVQIREAKYRPVIKYISQDWIIKLWNIGIVLVKGAIIKGILARREVPSVSITLIFDFERISPDKCKKIDMKIQFERFSIRYTQKGESFAKSIFSRPLK